MYPHVERGFSSKSDLDMAGQAKTLSWKSVRNALGERWRRWRGYTRVAEGR
jgi:hypothetical protein